MKKVIDWIFTIPFLLVFGLILLAFHPLQVIALNLGGYKAHKAVVDCMCFCLVQNMRLTMSSMHLENRVANIPTNRPLIIVSNHQSSLDIPMIAWLLRKYHPKYISKDSLTKGIPSISYNIRNGGSVTIDREKPSEAVAKIKNFAEYLVKHNSSACIFPEGTRAKDGKMNPFKAKGLIQLLESMPSALVVVVAITENWKIERYNLCPVMAGNKFSCTAFASLEPQDFSPEDLVAETERLIREHLGQNG